MRPETVQEVAFAGAVQVIPPGFEVIVYPVIAEPPVLAGALKLTTVAPDVLLDAEVFVGAPGVVAGVTDADAVDESERATPLKAVTTNVYAVPFDSPGTLQEVALGITSQVAPPGEAVIV